MKEMKKYARAIARVEYHLGDEHSEFRERELQDLSDGLRETLYDLMCEECIYPNVGCVGWDDQYCDYDEATEKTNDLIEEAKEELLYEKTRKHRSKSSKKTA